MSAPNRIVTAACGAIVGCAGTWLLTRSRLRAVEAERDEPLALLNRFDRHRQGESERDQLRHDAVERFNRLEELRAAANALVDALSGPETIDDNVNIVKQRVIDASGAYREVDHVSELASDLVAVASLRDLEGAREIRDQLLSAS
jgi:hypothetical protein